MGPLLFRNVWALITQLLLPVTGCCYNVNAGEEAASLPVASTRSVRPRVRSEGTLVSQVRQWLQNMWWKTRGGCALSYIMTRSRFLPSVLDQPTDEKVKQPWCPSHSRLRFNSWQMYSMVMNNILDVKVKIFHLYHVITVTTQSKAEAETYTNERRCSVNPLCVALVLVTFMSFVVVQDSLISRS